MDFLSIFFLFKFVISSLPCLLCKRFNAMEKIDATSTTLAMLKCNIRHIFRFHMKWVQLYIIIVYSTCITLHVSWWHMLVFLQCDVRFILYSALKHDKKIWQKVTHYYPRHHTLSTIVNLVEFLAKVDTDNNFYSLQLIRLAGIN